MPHSFMTIIVICNNAVVLSRHDGLQHRQHERRRLVQVTAVGNIICYTGPVDRLCWLCQNQNSHADCGRRQAAVYQVQLPQMTLTTTLLVQQQMIPHGYFSYNDNVNAWQSIVCQVWAEQPPACFEHPDRSAMAMTIWPRDNHSWTAWQLWCRDLDGHSRPWHI